MTKSVKNLEDKASHEQEMEKAVRTLHQWKLRAEGAMLAAGEVFREWDTALDESLYSGAMESILGIYPHELSPRFETWISLIHADDRAEYQQEIERVHEGRRNDKPNKNTQSRECHAMCPFPKM